MSRMRIIYPEHEAPRGRRPRMDDPRSERGVHPNYETLPRARRDGRGRFTAAYDEYYGYSPEGRRMIGFTGSAGQMSGGSSMEPGGYSYQEDEALSMDEALEWVDSMSDGKDKGGEHWSMDQTRELMHKRGYRHDPAEWYAIIHAMYYDYCTVARKYGLQNNDDFFADLAHAWLDDKDAVENKAAVYYEYIAQH